MPGPCRRQPAVGPRLLRRTPPPPPTSLSAPESVRPGDGKRNPLEAAAWRTGHPSQTSQRQAARPSPRTRLLTSFPPGPPTGAGPKLGLPCKRPRKGPPHLGAARGAGQLAGSENSGSLPHADGKGWTYHGEAEANARTSMAEKEREGSGRTYLVALTGWGYGD